MKKTGLFIVIAIFLFACDSTDLEMKEEFYPSGKLKLTYYDDSNGDWQGECRVYFETGELEQIKYYKDDHLNGKYLQYDKMGILRTKSKFKNDKEIDTTFVYRENGILERYSIYNNRSEDLKDVFFYPNGKLEKIRTFSIGTGEINAFKSYSDDGKLITKYGSSKFVTFKNVRDTILFKLYGLQLEKTDSIVISVVKDFDFNHFDVFPQVIRHTTYLDNKPLKFKIQNSDYLSNKVSLLIQVYGVMDGYTNSQPFHVQFQKGQKLPQDNLYPIYVK